MDRVLRLIKFKKKNIRRYLKLKTFTQFYLSIQNM